MIEISEFYHTNYQFKLGTFPNFDDKDDVEHSQIYRIVKETKFDNHRHFFLN